MKNKKKKLIAILLALSCLLIVVVGSLAYEQPYTKTRNIITTGKIDIEVNEYADEAMTTPFPETGIDGIMPGRVVTKIVEVENKGDSPAWVRVKVNKTITLAEGVAGDPNPSLISLDISDSVDSPWVYADGWYYYKTQLPARETTVAPLFTQVTFASNMDNIYQNSTAKVSVIAQAVQVKSNGESYDTAQGWPEGGD